MIFPAREKLPFLLARALPAITIAWVSVIFLSLHFHFLDPLVPTTWHGRMGFDFFSVPRAFLNLRHGISIYNTRASAYGPYATWYPYHPAVAVFAGSWLSLFAPWGAFYIFAAASLAGLAVCARLIGGLSGDLLTRRFCYFLMLFPLPVYLMVWNGQMHVFLVCGFALLFYALARIILDRDAGEAALMPWLVCGILLSLLSKPLVALALPALFAVRVCRKSVVYSLVSYVTLSLLFIFVPFLNPQGMGFLKLLRLAANPAGLFRMEIYRGVAFMSYRPEVLADNAIHWFNMGMRQSLARPEHFESMDLPSFFANLSGYPLPALLMKLPALLVLAFSVGLYFVKGERRRAKGAIVALILCSLAFILSTGRVYEYYFAILLPAMAVLFVLHPREEDVQNAALIKWFCACGALLLVPTPYYFVSNPAYGFHRAVTATMNEVYVAVFTGGHIYDWALALIRWNRTLPALAMFVLLAIWGWRIVFCGGVENA